MNRLLETSGLHLSLETVKKLDAFADHLMAWNRIHNLTGAKTREAVDTQILDSVWPVTFLDRTPETLIDIGTGAGFPGLILAIVWPKTKTTLCEPLQKRAAFLRFVARELDLNNVSVENRRIEDVKPSPFDLITSRAVTETSTLIEWSRPFIKTGTQMLFYKGEQVFGEIDGLEACRIELISRDKRNYLWIKDASKC